MKNALRICELSQKLGPIRYPETWNSHRQPATTPRSDISSRTDHGPPCPEWWHDHLPQREEILRHTYKYKHDKLVTVYYTPGPQAKVTAKACRDPHRHNRAVFLFFSRTVRLSVMIVLYSSMPFTVNYIACIALGLHYWVCISVALDSLNQSQIWTESWICTVL